MTPSSMDRAAWSAVRDFLAALREAARNAPEPADRSAHEVGPGGRSVQELYSRTLLLESALRDFESRAAVLDADEQRVSSEFEALAGAWRSLGSGGDLGEAGFSSLVARTEAAAALWTRLAERERKSLRRFLRVSGAWRWAVATLLERSAGPGSGSDPAALAGMRRRLLELEARRQELLGRMGGMLSAGFGVDTETLARHAATIMAVLEAVRGRVSELEDEAQGYRGRVAALEGEVETWRGRASAWESDAGRRAAEIEADAARRAAEAETESAQRIAAVESESAKRLAMTKARLEVSLREAEGLSGQVQQVRVESSRLRARLDEELSAHAETSLALGESRAREARLGSQVKGLAGELEAAGAEVGRLTASLGEARAREDDLAGRVSEIKSALDEARLRQEGLAAKLGEAELRAAQEGSQAQASRAEVEAEDARLKDELEALRAEKERTGQERAELSDAVGLLQDALETRTALLAESEAARKAMEAAGSGAGLRVQALEEEVRCLHAAAMEAAMASGAEMKALRVEIGSLVHVLETEKTRAADLVQALGAEKARFAGLARALETERARSNALSQALEAEKARSAALARALDSEKAKCAALAKEIGSLTEKTGAADAASRQSEGLRGELAKAQVRLARLSQELESRFALKGSPSGALKGSPAGGSAPS